MRSLGYNIENFKKIQDENTELHLLITRLTAQLLLARAEHDNTGTSSPRGTDSRGEDGASKAPRRKGKSKEV